MTRMYLTVAAMAATSVAFAQTPFDEHGLRDDCVIARGEAVLEVPSGDPTAPLAGPCWVEIRGIRYECTFSLTSDMDDVNVAYDPDTNTIRLAGFGKETYDFGPLGRYHGWEIFNFTFDAANPFLLHGYGASMSGPPADGSIFDAGYPTWGTGAFTKAVFSSRWRGDLHQWVEKEPGVFVDRGVFPLEQATFCGVDWKALRMAR